MKTQWNDAPGGFHPASAPDFLPRRELERVQLGRLQAVVGRAYERVALLRARMEEKGLRPDAVRSLADLARLPFTTKADLRDTYPFGLFASPMEEIVRLHASSGTTGKPIVVAYTEADLQVWTSVMVRSFAACGLHKGDVIQNAYGYGLFTGGLGAHYGAESLGATVIPISGGNTERQLMVLQDFNVTAICCTPSYFVHLVERAKEAKIGFGRLKVGIFGAEPWSESMRRYIQEESGIRAHDIYGLSEIIGPGVGIECPAQGHRPLADLHLLLGQRRWHRQARRIDFQQRQHPCLVRADGLSHKTLIGARHGDEHPDPDELHHGECGSGSEFQRDASEWHCALDGDVYQRFEQRQQLFVEGRLVYDTWTAQDGSKRSKHRVQVENFQFLGGPKGAADLERPRLSGSLIGAREID